MAFEWCQSQIAEAGFVSAARWYVGIASGKTGNTGVGLAGIGERLKELGGFLEIESTLDGTLLRATIPFPSAATQQREVRNQFLCKTKLRMRSPWIRGNRPELLSSALE